VDNGRIVGMLHHSMLFQGLRERGDAALIADVMRHQFVTLQAVRCWTKPWPKCALRAD